MRAQANTAGVRGSPGARPRALFVTAFKTEINAVCAHLTGLGQYTERKTQTVFETGSFSGPQGDWEVFVCEVGKGNRAAASITTVGIMALDPDVVVFAGVAGGCKDVSKGDVVAADKIYYYEAGADGATFRPRPDIGKPSHRMVQQARAVNRKDKWQHRVINPTENSPKGHIGAIAAGEKVVKKTVSPTFQLIKSNFSDSLAVEMEGSGVLEAVHLCGVVDAIVVRGISDLVDDKDEQQDEKWQPIAAQNASAFAFELLACLGSGELHASRSSRLDSMMNRKRDDTALLHEVEKELASATAASTLSPEKGELDKHRLILEKAYSIVFAFEKRLGRQMTSSELLAGPTAVTPLLREFASYCTRVEAGIDTIMFVPQRGLFNQQPKHSVTFIDFAETTPKGAIFLYAPESFKTKETFARFVRMVFHELGHVVLHFNKLLIQPRSKTQTNEEEVEAWIFSHCLVALLASRDVMGGGEPSWTGK